MFGPRGDGYYSPRTDGLRSERVSAMSIPRERQGVSGVIVVRGSVSRQVCRGGRMFNVKLGSHSLGEHTLKEKAMPIAISRYLPYVAAIILGWFCLISPALAQQLPDPEGDPILTISGKVTVTNQGDTAVFDREMLEALGTRSFTTMTPWYDDPVTFEGVPLADLMETVGATGDTILAVALNDYTSEIPIADFEAHGTILALKRNGEYMPVHDKGPLFVVYPYDSDDSLKNQIYYARSAWQVYQMIVR